MYQWVETETLRTCSVAGVEAGEKGQNTELGGPWMTDPRDSSVQAPLGSTGAVAEARRLAHYLVGGVPDE